MHNYDKGDYPYAVDVALPEPVEVTGTAGSVVFAHYLLAHASGVSAEHMYNCLRETIYLRFFTE